METGTDFILTIDSGGLSLRTMLFDHSGMAKETVQIPTPAKYPEEGAVEHDPEELWDILLQALRKLMEQSRCQPDQIKGIGITNQRASFCLVDKATGIPVTNLISWSDLRATEVAEKMDRKFAWKCLRGISKLLGPITGNKMLQTTAMLHMIPTFGICRLRWLFEQETVRYRNSEMTGKELYNRCKKGEILFCTLDTWFIYKLTGRKHHLTDYTNASGSSMFNPFDLKWNSIYSSLFKIPLNIFPEVRDTNGQFGETEPSILGKAVPIGAAVGDQSAALFGHCCFEPGDTKVSQGTGAFVDMCVGLKPQLSRRGLFPLIAWALDGEVSYMLEGQVATVGMLIDWLGEGIGISDTPAVLNDFASQTQDTEGVIFVPTLSGISFPYFHPRTKATIFGLSLSVHRRHVARAILEGLAMRVYDVLGGMEKDTGIHLKQIKADGGVSQSDIELQALADFAGISVKRSPIKELTSTGAAFFAGLSVGFWKDLNELKELQKGYVEFSPKMEDSRRQKKVTRWTDALKTVMKFYGN